MVAFPVSGDRITKRTMPPHPQGILPIYQRVIVPRIAVNPASRIGYVNGPATSQLQEFIY